MASIWGGIPRLKSHESTKEFDQRSELEAAFKLRLNQGAHVFRSDHPAAALVAASIYSYAEVLPDGTATEWLLEENLGRDGSDDAARVLDLRMVGILRPTRFRLREFLETSSPDEVMLNDMLVYENPDGERSRSFRIRHMLIEPPAGHLAEYFEGQPAWLGDDLYPSHLQA